MRVKYAWFALVFSLALNSQTFAQPGTEGGAEHDPAKIFMGRTITSLGVTKPPGRASSPAKLAVVIKRTQQERVDDAIMRGVCRGCY